MGVETNDDEKQASVPEYSQSVSQSQSQQVMDDEDVIVMTQKVNVQDVDNKIVIAAEPELELLKVTDEGINDDDKKQSKNTFDAVKNEENAIPKPIVKKVKKPPPSYRPPPPKVPNMKPPPLPNNRLPPKPSGTQPKDLIRQWL